MGFREDLSRRIERKRAEIDGLETQVRLAKEYLQALEDTFKMLPKGAEDSSVSSTPVLRAGTALAKARDALRAAGKPMHISELLNAIGKGTSRNERAGLSGTLAAYVRRGEIFTRPAPNTFSLVELEINAAPLLANTESVAASNGPPPPISRPRDPSEPMPPPGFGKL